MTYTRQAKHYAALPAVVFCGLIVWFFLLSGLVRIYFEDYSRTAVAGLTVLASIAAGYVMWHFRNKRSIRIAFWLTGMFTIWVCVAGLVNSTPLWALLAGLGILATFPMLLLLGRFSITHRARFRLVPMLRTILVINLVVIGFQLLAGDDVDRGVGLLGNDRASNTIALFTMLTSIALWVRGRRVISLDMMAVITAITFSWFGDSKASLALVLVILFVWIVVALFEDRVRWAHTPLGRPELLKLSTAFAVALVASGFALQGIGTGSAANLGPAVREGLMGMYRPVIPQTPEIGAEERDGAAAIVINAERSSIWMGSGLATGSSLLGSLVSQELLSFPGAASLAQQHQERLQERSLEWVNSGLLYSPLKTLLGLLDEVGILGMSLYVALVALVFAQFRRLVRPGAYLGAATAIGIALFFTPFLEYPEVALSFSAFLLLLSTEVTSEP